VTEIYVALITGGLSLLGVFVSNTMAARQTTAKIETNQAVTNEKISELTREVREHNDFARRVPVVEEQIKVINHRLEDIEKENSIYHRKGA
jgi:primosomal protein N''